MKNIKIHFKDGSRAGSPPLLDNVIVNNPTYDPSDDDEWNDGYDDEDDDDYSEFNQQDFDDTVNRMEYHLENITRQEETDRLQLTSLRKGKDLEDSSIAKWRRGPAPTEDRTETVGLKLASLKNTIGDDFDSKQLFENIFNFTQWEMTSDDSQTNSTASSTLINYFAYLGTTNELGVVDYDFLDMLVKVADINAVDMYGQSIMHEVAREWNTDLARYIKLHGGNIDLPDQYGRTPLFVAVSSNHTTMVRWLIDNGANINHATIDGEGRKPIHFAAMASSIEAFDLLVQYGASPVERDEKDRTPFYLAAERAQYSMCEHLLHLELPVATYSAVGVSTIDHIISKLPTKLAYEALDQFLYEDKQNNKEKYYLSCLGKRRWKLLTNFKHIAPTGDPPNPIEIIVERNDIDLIMHPVILKYLEAMSRQFGAKYTNINIFLCLLFTTIWTIAITLYDRTTPFVTSEPKVDARISMTVLGQILTIYFIYKFWKEYTHLKRRCMHEKARMNADVNENKRFSHPRWTGEENLLKKQKEVAGRLSSNFWADGWNYIEGLCLLMSCLQTILVILLASTPTNKTLEKVLLYYSCAFALVVWLRLNRCLRSHPTFGPFIAMLAECVTAVTRFAFLFMEFYVPFTCAFWVVFGGNRKGTVTEYTYFNDLIYQLFLMAIVGDYDFDTLSAENKVMAQILVFMYFILISIISLNLFIALLSEAFERVRRKAAAGTYLQKAKDYIGITREHPTLYRKFEIFLNDKASPLVLDRAYNRSAEIESSRQSSEEISKLISGLVAQMEYIQANHKKFVQGIEFGDKQFRKFQGKYSFKDLTKITKLLRMLSNKQFYDLDKPVFQRLSEKIQVIRDKGVRFSGVDDFSSDLKFEEFEFEP